MTERTLIPLDGSESSDDVIEHAARLVRRTRGRGRLDLLRVVPPFDPTSAERGEHPRETKALRLRVDAAQRHLDERVEQLRIRGLEAIARVRVGEPESAIRDAIAELEPSLIAMMTHGRRGPSRWIQGSVAEALLRETDVPLLLVNASRCKAPALLPYSKVLLPLDGTRRSEAALDLLEQLAPQPRPHVVLARFAHLPVLAAPWPLVPAGVPAAHDTGELQQSLQPAAERLTAHGFDASLRVAFGDPVDLILTTVEREGVELLVMATHGAEGLERLLCGSVTESVLRRAPCPLLVTRTGPRGEAP